MSECIVGTGAKMTFSYLVLVFIISSASLIESSPQQSVTALPQVTKLNDDEVKHLQSRGFGPTISSAYVSALEAQYDDDEYEDHETSATQQRTPSYSDSPYLYQQNVIPVKQTRAQYREPVQQVVREQVQHQQQVITRPNKQGQRQNFKQIEGDLIDKEEEEEIEEPDRLSLLLPQSKFACTNKNTGYYADEELGCEVFHYCQDNARHSWICPEGFTFHQVHLICMPPGGDNICEKSSQFHFVNEYLYKPVNLEEYQRKPNTSLKYADRYYPEQYREDEREENQQVNHHRNSIRVQYQEQENTPRSLLVEKPAARTTFRPETTLGQVFRSPNEVNIPLQQRRPQQYLAQRYYNEE